VTADDRRGRPGYHDPMAGIGGAPVAQSALTLRLVLAIFGLVFCSGAAVGAWVLGLIWLAVALIVLAIVAAIDIVVIARRKRRGEPG
jgi:Family of unknown function (DUF6343)